ENVSWRININKNSQDWTTAEPRLSRPLSTEWSTTETPLTRPLSTEWSTGKPRLSRPLSTEAKFFIESNLLSSES
ncbi:hypothetical protein AVEN_189491-1, partial [Araneus ventricosus]